MNKKTHDAEMMATIEDLKRENAVLKAKQENLVEATKALKENAILKADIEKKRLEVEQLQRYKSDSTKDRSMSRMTGAQVVVNKPAIADLRETFSELNDNEWIETMEELSNTMLNEQDVIQHLSMIVCKYRQDKHVAHTDVRKQPVNPVEKKDKPLTHLHNSKTNRREVKQDDTSTSTESDQADREEHLRDDFRVVIPEGCMVVKSTEYEQMQYGLNNQRKSIEELTSRMGQKQLQNVNENRRKVKQDDKSTSTESDQAGTDHLRDHGNFRVVIPEGYMIVKSSEYEQMQYDLNNQRERIEELTSLLSAIASNKLKEGNPNIAALSDKNRPTKLAEQFAFMYDDQWSEAFEEISAGKEQNDEEDITSIIKLLDVVKASYHFCGAEADRQLQKIAMGMNDALCLSQMVEAVAAKESTKRDSAQRGRADKMSGTVDRQSGQKPRANTPMSNTNQVVLKCAHSYQKETALIAVTQIKQLFKDFYIPMLKLGPGATPPDAMMKYIDRCVELVWLMAVQDPPMEIKWVERGDRSNTDYFKFYQSKGKMAKECVWPAVFLCAQGGIVSKGYIVGMDPPPEKKKQKKTK